MPRGNPALHVPGLLRAHAALPKRPHLDIEASLSRQGCRHIAGVDEVGRGPLAGPVVAAAAVLPATLPDEWSGLVRDSKQLSHEQREKAYGHIVTAARDWGVGACSSAEIDALGIAVASRLAMMRAVEELEHAPDHLLIDAVSLPALSTPQTAIIKGDAISASIAAASIIAKVTRDRLMADFFDGQYPGYGFASHKGYYTAEHMTALHDLGPCPIHRTSFAPVRDALGQVAT